MYKYVVKNNRKLHLDHRCGADSCRIPFSLHKVEHRSQYIQLGLMQQGVLHVPLHQQLALFHAARVWLRIRGASCDRRNRFERSREKLLSRNAP